MPTVLNRIQSKVDVDGKVTVSRTDITALANQIITTARTAPEQLPHIVRKDFEAQLKTGKRYLKQLKRQAKREKDLTQVLEIKDEIKEVNQAKRALLVVALKQTFRDDKQRSNVLTGSRKLHTVIHSGIVGLVTNYLVGVANNDWAKETISKVDKNYILFQVNNWSMSTTHITPSGDATLIGVGVLATIAIDYYRLRWRDINRQEVEA